MNNRQAIIKRLKEGDSAYQEFFRNALKKFGSKTPADMSDEEKDKFFTYIEKNWNDEDPATDDKDTHDEGVEECGELEFKKKKKKESAEDKFRAIIRKEIAGALSEEVDTKESNIRKIIKEEIKLLLAEGTRSRVGILNPDGTIESIYVHWDGDLSGVGKTLKSFYKNQAIAKKLIAMGNASSLYKNITPKGKDHSFNSPEANVSVFYGRDRGETGEDSKQSKGVVGFAKLASQWNAEYIYLLDPKTKKWVYSKGTNVRNIDDFKSF